MLDGTKTTLKLHFGNTDIKTSFCYGYVMHLHG